MAPLLQMQTLTPNPIQNQDPLLTTPTPTPTMMTTTLTPTPTPMMTPTPNLSLIQTLIPISTPTLAPTHAQIPIQIRTQPIDSKSWIIDSGAGTDIHTKEILGHGTKRGGLYYVDDFSPSVANSVTHLFDSKQKQIWLWHRRLGHPSFSYMKHLIPDDRTRTKFRFGIRVEPCACPTLGEVRAQMTYLPFYLKF
ncbi:hypothetical protein L3X38_041235 [Prunus dulcis]|uniref:GAG-pre-integrase domain-containing protein n=1 Tax=Prunus dulcis TaxID=3755 RepID=A0AAD4UUJ3_PRUDU|nr:hypothetical protein L3X38_041235 [Prunus dulcis]